MSGNLRSHLPLKHTSFSSRVAEKGCYHPRQQLMFNSVRKTQTLARERLKWWHLCNVSWLHGSAGRQRKHRRCRRRARCSVPTVTGRNGECPFFPHENLFHQISHQQTHHDISEALATSCQACFPAAPPTRAASATAGVITGLIVPVKYCLVCWSQAAPAACCSDSGAAAF